MNFSRKEDRIYTSPAVFGPALCPMQNIEGERYKGKQAYVRQYSVTYQVDEKQLCEIIPDMFELTEPHIQIFIEELNQIAWLGGRGLYRINIQVPVSLNGERGLFNLVTWENNGDSVIQDRDIRGIAKMYAQIDQRIEGQSVSFSVKSWDFEYLNICIESEPPIENSGKEKQGYPTFHYRFAPKTARPFNIPDAEYITRIPAEKMDVMEEAGAVGTVKWEYPQFEDAPTQYYFIQKLAEMEPKNYVSTEFKTFDRADSCFGQTIVWEVK